MRRILVAIGVAALVGAAVPVLAESKPKTKRASVRSNGTEANQRSDDVDISANGRYMVFESNADNLSPDDGNGDMDVFIHDRVTGKTKRMSVTSGEEGAEGSSSNPSVSANGRWVAFMSAASLVAGDDNGDDDIYVRDRKTGRTRRVSVGSDGSQADESSDEPAISANGRYVAFTSYADLQPQDSNNSYDIYVHDRKTKSTRLASLDSAEEQTDPTDIHEEPDISADGRFVMWSSNSDDLVPNDLNGTYDLFLRDRKRGRTTRVSLTSSEGEIDGVGYASMSDNGRFIAFESDDNTVVPNEGPESDVYVRDRKRGTTKRASVWEGKPEPDDFVGYAQISPDGRFVTFCSPATNVDRNFSSDDIFIRDMKGRTTKLVSVPASEDGAPNGNCYSDVSAGGRWVAWITGKELDPSDGNVADDVYFRGPLRWR
jgi:Tol biopolymer transport system component